MKYIIRILFIVSGALLCADTLFARMLSNGNLGTYLPAIMGLPLLALGIFYSPLCIWFASGGLGAAVKWLLLCGYAAAVLFFAVMGAVIGSAAQQPFVKSDALIVLGCSVRGSRVSLTLAHRLDKACEYLEAYPDAVCIVSGGQGDGEDIPEAQAMKKYLVSAGIADARIIEESQSESTYENFAFSKAIIDERLGTDASISFITTEFHVYRAARVAAKQGITAHGTGAAGVWYIAPNDFLRECVAVAVYCLNGQI